MSLRSAGNAEAQPIDREVPEDDGQHEEDALGDGAVLVREAVLRGVGDDDDEEKIGDADRARLAAQQEAQDGDEAEIHDGAAQEYLQQRVHGHEHALEIQREQAFHGAGYLELRQPQEP